MEQPRKKARKDVNSAKDSNSTTESNKDGGQAPEEVNGNNGNEKPYEIVQAYDTRQWKRGVEEKTYSVKFDQSKAGTKLLDIKDNLESMFNDVVNIASQQYDKSDKAQITINHGGMREEVFIHLQDLSNISGESIMRRFEKVLNSNEEMCVDDSFDIHVGLMKLTKGGGPAKPSGRTLPLYPHLNNTPHSSVLNKKAIIEISCGTDEYLCAAKSIVICMAKLQNIAYKSLTRRQSSQGDNSLKTRATELQKKTGLPTNRPLTIRELAAFEDVLKVKIVVIQFRGNNDKPCITQCSKRECEDIIFLYHTDNHFHAVSNVSAMFPKHIVCTKCLHTYASKNKCCPQCSPSCCYVCRRVDCEPDKSIMCRDCNFRCRSQECFDFHKEQPVGKSGKLLGKSPCEAKWKCLSCERVVFTHKHLVENHVCGQYYCKNCQEHVEQNHLCFHRRRAPKATSGKFIFFDFETMQDGLHQCEKGYSPPVQDDVCKLCTEESKCTKCRTCTNCKTTSCGRNFHQPNLVVCQSVCDDCKDDPLLEGATCRSCGDLCKNCSKGKCLEAGDDCLWADCGRRELVFSGMNTVGDFCKWLISPTHKNYTVLAHNGKSFDFCFILGYCVTEAHMKPDCIYAGSKIMSMTISDGLNIRFIDSLNFMSMSLKKLPKAFGLAPESELGCGETEGELRKGDFPHKMNRREFQNYVGPFPPLSMFCVDRMEKTERAKFIEWHSEQNGRTFDLQAEMLAYCRQDVVILRLACMRFRELFLEITTKVDSDGNITGFVDPFAHITIASACMQIYRVNFMKEYFDVELSDFRAGRAVFQAGEWTFEGELISAEDITSKQFVSSCIAQIPAQGYVRNSRHSSKSIAWLEWEAKKLGRQIQHARNVGEQMIFCKGKRYLADGFDKETGTIFEFHGCRFHGCPTCTKNRKIKDPRTGYTLKELHEMTVKRTAAMRACGYRVKEMYECRFDEMAKENEELASFLENEFNVPPRMKIRQAFYGGRTSCFTLFRECQEELGEEIHYADVCSLYPFINKMAKMPIGHPEIISRDFDMTLQSYFGIAHVTLLPPKDVYVPCLPVRVNGKLTFPLCNKCAADENHGDCNHADKERALTGVWCTPELMVAIEQGYKIIQIYEVYNYSETSQYDPETRTGGLFSEQVDLFLKIKTEASGYPDWVQSPTQEDEFIRSFKNKVGVQLDKERIAKNPALRSIAKICLNSFWGKLGERNNKLKTKFISSTAELEKVTNDSRHELHRLHIINEDVMVIEFDNLDQFEEDSNTTNEVIAAFTTCFARLELLKHISVVGRDILYCDTDSLIWVTRNTGMVNGKKTYDVYPELGDSLGELTNELAPGVHITRFVTTAPKSYSYRCNDDSEICKFKGVTLNFQNSLQINFEAVRELLFGEKESITLAPETQFTRSKFDGKIFNTPLNKTVKPTFNKRKILDNFDTVPFGFM